MNRLKQILSLPMCFAAICCGRAVTPYRGAADREDRLAEPQGAVKGASAFTLPEHSLQAADFSAPSRFSKMPDEDAASPPAGPKSDWKPRADLGAGLPSAAEEKAADAKEMLSPLPGRIPGVSVSDKRAE